ncbi:MAG: insulinase family protein [Deltaproteobacteria bacterium]|nr:MAG: insulinase family protein [Deltaproteobacteria bacterium]
MIALLLSLTSAQAVDIPHQTFELENGLEVVLIPDRSLPKVVVDVWYDVGSYDDPEGRSGFAHLFEHLMFKGTARVGEGQFDTLMEEAGGWNNATTADDRTNYFNVGPSSALELLLWLEADRMTSLDITQNKLDVEREVVRNEKRQNYEDRPYGGMWIALPPALYPKDNPLHRPGIGSHEELMAATLQDVTAFYETFYVPSNAVLAVAGDFDPDQTRELITTLFGGLPARPKPERQLVEMSDTPAKDRVVLHDDVSLVMTRLAWHAAPSYTDEDAALDVLAHILGGSQDARLQRALVHESSLAVDVGAGMWSSRWGGVFSINAVLPPQERSEAEAGEAALRQAVYTEIQALAGDRPPTADEVARAVRNLELSVVEGIETLLGRAEQLQRYRLHTGEFDYVERDVARYRRVTPQAVIDQAKLLTADRSTTIAVFPRPAGHQGGAP